MTIYVQYHKTHEHGLPDLENAFGEIEETGIFTDKGKLLEQAAAEGGLCFLIAGLGTPRKYYLWKAFRIRKKRRLDARTCIGSGKGWMLNPPQLLSGPKFEAFRDELANFQAGFKCIENLPYTETLLNLSNQFRRKTIDLETENFCRILCELEPEDQSAKDLLKWVSKKIQEGDPKN